jgi:hypothetical protein
MLCAFTPTAPGQPQYVSSTQSAITIKWAPPADSGGAFVEDYEIFYKLASQSELSWSQVGTVDLNTL